MATVSITVTEACLRWMRLNWDKARPEIKDEYKRVSKVLTKTEN